MKMHNNICCLAWDNKKMQKIKSHVKPLLHEQSPAVFSNVFNTNAALWLIAGRSLKHKQTGTEKSDYNVFSIVTHCDSCPLANKSPLNPSIQGLGAASHRLCLHLCKLPDHQPSSLKQPTYWSHFSIFFQLSCIATQLLPPSSSCTRTELIYALALFWLWFQPH